MPYSKIAVGVDFSPQSQVAVQRAMDVARRTDAEVVLVHAGEMPAQVQGLDPSMQSTFEKYEATLRERLDETRKELETLRESLVGQGPEVSNLLIEDFADQALVQAAEDLHADLVVVGTHGRTGVSWVALGSVAQRVVRTAPCDVLVSKGDGNSAGGFGKILVPMDFSPSALAAFERALELMAEGAEIDLLHCVDAVPKGHIFTSEPRAFRELSEEIAEGMREKGRALIESVTREDLTLRFHVQEASPKTMIAEWSERHGYDLIAMGSRGMRGVRRWFLGSVAEHTAARAKCSVLVCRIAGRE